MKRSHLLPLLALLLTVAAAACDIRNRDGGGDDDDLLDDDDVLVCAGGRRDSGNGRISQVSAAGDLLWDLHVLNDLWTYRAERVDWVSAVE